jgi:SAM-dependent methyltransferase
MPSLFQAAAHLAQRVNWRVRRQWLGLTPKQFNEREFWRLEKKLYLQWFHGKIKDLYGLPPPRADQIVRGRNGDETALLTLHRVIEREAQGYARQLCLPRDYFKGLTIADIGCGPMGAALVFTECEVVGVDPLVDIYRGLGFPLATYSARMKFISAGSEKIPLPDGSVDGVISVNAIEHVDDFEAAAREIRRIVKPGGIVRIQAHYHEPTSCEPWSLDDAMMIRAFGALGLRKLIHEPFSHFYPGAARGEEIITLWGNTDLVQRA